MTTDIEGGVALVTGAPTTGHPFVTGSTVSVDGGGRAR